MYQGILEPISNRADWFGTIELVNDDTNEVITDLSGVSVRLEVRSAPQNTTGYNYYNGGYGFVENCSQVVLTASTDTGEITIVGSVIEWHFTPAQLANLCAGSYAIGVLVSRDNITEQELVATLPVIDGIVRP